MYTDSETRKKCFMMSDAMPRLLNHKMHSLSDAHSSLEHDHGGHCALVLLLGAFFDKRKFSIPGMGRAVGCPSLHA